MDAVQELVDELGADVVRTSSEQREAYRYDWARDPEAALPVAVVLPRSTAHVQAVMRWATKHRVPVVPRGAGSGLSGGASAHEAALVLCLERMNEITVDPATRTLRAQAGALNKELKTAAAKHGLWYPPDPSSFEISTIGGNVATNAGGLCCVKYGVTVDYVLGLEAVLADGRVITLGGPRVKDVAGLPLLKLLVGSEGTLAVVTEVLCRLVPILAPPATLVATFAGLTDAADAVVRICSTTRPSMVEFMDNASINAVEDFQPMGLDRSAGALLLVQSDAAGESRELEIAAVRQACEEFGATEVFETDDPEEGALFVGARRAVFPALERLGAYMLEDVGVPVPRLPELVDRVARIATEQQLLITVVAHAGDGNTHPVIVYDGSDEDEKTRAGQAFTQIMELALSLDGTITGEHGVGRLKRPLLRQQLGDDVLELQHGMRKVWDPLGLLNPGAGY
ncbi:FAD-binding oxidoreductase [Yimella sp. cx-51]|uniref:FAD-binding oxidoreductase n=1 Tax=Yimella sp. cx-51 TaxID=2770551 RepID=UPI00165E535A|nr:FAD-linked oxidase C-terminal domain-containing protein [Yimella sp. cx-51]MBC9957794.1 FAD-binding protein [Yimella sp. cx-51]MBD2758810.1 FAD-binding protein [Yimella sp. cx-573]QTH36863.1 FAD-binding protein [Yimella sp. cx-51]